MAENQLILIADDFGLSHGINRGIIELLRLGHLSGTSVMVNMPAFVDGASELAQFKERADLGLHLTLTLGAPLGQMPKFAPDGQFPELPFLMRRAFLYQIPRNEVGDEIRRQILRFKDIMGFLPHYIDGHQHVHILPHIRTALFNALKTFPEYRPWLRDPHDAVKRILQRRVCMTKSLFISWLSSGFAHRAHKRGYLTNSSFSGVSNFDPSDNFAAAFQSYLNAPTGQHLVMCHPGYLDHNEKLADPVSDTRPIELEFLKSEKFLSLLHASKLKLGRMTHIEQD